MDMKGEDILSGDQPTLHTDRLILRPFVSSDAKMVAEYAGHEDIAKMTLRIPHPYTVSLATDFFSMANNAWKSKEEVIFGIVPKDVGHIIGAVGLSLNVSHDTGELGYWIGVPFQGYGYATEATKRIMTFGFHDLDLVCIYGEHFSKNPASGKVMQKLGMMHEGQLKSRYKKWGEYLDIDMYSILKTEFHGS